MGEKNRSVQKIKILRIIARLNIGGPAIHTILLTEGLDKKRFCSVLVTGTVEKSEADMMYLAREKGVRPVIIPELGRTLNIRNDIIAFWKLFHLIKKEKPNIIHTHTAKAGALGRLAALLYSLSSWPLARNLQPKLIHTFHGHVLHGYFSRMKSTFFTWVEKFFALFTHKIIAVSESVRKELIDLRIALPDKIVTIPLGLELGKYFKINNKYLKKRANRSVGIIGRLAPVKNHKMFLDTVKILRDNLSTEKEIKFVIVGDGHLRQELEKYAERLGIKQNVIFQGWKKDLTKIYTELEIVTLTSVNEGTPVALIEAMAAGKPVISTDVGGVKDLFSNQFETKKDESIPTIRYYDQGILVGSGDVESLAVAIQELLKNEKLRENMGKMGRKTIYPKYDISRLIDDLNGLYLNLTGGQK